MYFGATLRFREHERENLIDPEMHVSVFCDWPAGWYLTGGMGGHVLVSGLRDPPHWSWFKRPWVGHIWSPSLE